MADLPSKELEGLWESLFYDGDVKSRLLSYIYATIGFSDADVDCKSQTDPAFCFSWLILGKATWCPGTGSSSCMVHPEQEKQACVEHFPKNSVFV